LNSVDLPTFGSPTIPQRKPMNYSDDEVWRRDRRGGAEKLGLRPGYLPRR
jgi:hypothetical protein